MAPTADEQSTYYGLIARSVTVPKSNTWVAFDLRPEARWHDGRPITAEDVVWSFNPLVEKGTPLYARYYADVTEATAYDADPDRSSFKICEPSDWESGCKYVWNSVVA